MRTKLVYVLVSDDSDYYYEMFLLSLRSFRLYHPNDAVEVLMDKQTHCWLNKKKTVLGDGVSLIVVEDIPAGYSKMQTSRFLKTRMRAIIKGDFLFIDNDTFICESLGEIDALNGVIGAVLDNHEEGCDYQAPFYPKEWNYVLTGTHFNSGVLYVKDQKDAYSFFEQWHNNWVYAEKRGCGFDQPALRKTILDSGILVHEMDGRWNCQVSRVASEKYQLTAKILHYQRNAFIISICKSIRGKKGINGEISEWVKFPRKAFSLNKAFLCQAEYQALQPILFSLHNYPCFYRFLKNLSVTYNRLVSMLYRIKQRFL